MQTLQPEPITAEEAGTRLGISAEAVRKRINRGKLSGYKAEDGHWYVYLPDDTLLLPGEQTDLTKKAAKPKPQARITDLKAEIAALRAQLDELQHDRDSWRAQAQGTLTALQQQQALSMTDRMKELPAIEAKPGFWQRVKKALTRKL